MRRKKWIKHPNRLPRTRFLAAMITFLMLLGAFGYVTALVAENRPFPRSPGYFNWSNEVICAAVVANVVASYLGARFVFYALSFTRSAESTEYCRKCLYNLTGNESGVCPECGTRQFSTCGKCGYDLTGNESGTCPECGSTGEIEFAKGALFFAGSRTLKWLLAGFLLCEFSLLIGLLDMAVNAARLLFTTFRPVSLSFLGLIATIVSVPMIAICGLKAASSRPARFLSFFVILCWILMIVGV